MKEKRYGTLGGLTVPVQVYSEHAEADKAAGKPAVLLDIANDNLHYRGGPAAATREYICDMLEEKTGVKRETRPVKDAKGVAKTKEENGKQVPVTEYVLSEGEYVRDVMAKKGLEDLSQYQPLVDAWARKADDGKPLAVDAKEPERKPKAPPKLSDEDKALATEFLDGKKDLKKFTTASAKYGIAAFTATGEREKDIVALGWLVRSYFKAKADEAKNKAKGEF